MSSRQDNLRNLLMLQRKEVPDCGLYGRLTFEDMKRIDKQISGDITKSLDCCMFLGKTKGAYCYFSFRGKKTSVLRLLFHNLIDDLKPEHKVIHSCKNKGLCCNLSHFTLVIEETPDFEQKDSILGFFNEKEDEDNNIFQFEE